MSAFYLDLKYYSFGCIGVLVVTHRISVVVHRFSSCGVLSPLLLSRNLLNMNASMSLGNGKDNSLEISADLEKEKMNTLSGLTVDKLRKMFLGMCNNGLFRIR